MLGLGTTINAIFLGLYVPKIYVGPFRRNQANIVPVKKNANVNENVLIHLSRSSLQYVIIRSKANKLYNKPSPLLTGSCHILKAFVWTLLPNIVYVVSFLIHLSSIPCILCPPLLPKTHRRRGSEGRNHRKTMCLSTHFHPQFVCV